MVRIPGKVLNSFSEIASGKILGAAGERNWDLFLGFLQIKKTNRIIEKSTYH